MTFTRRSDSTTLNPLQVITPFEQAREASTVVRRVGQSSDVRVTYVGAAGPREGELRLLFESYLTVNAASEFFAASSLFEWDGGDTGPGAYAIVDDYIVETADTVIGAYALVFAVNGPPSFRGSDDEGWELRVRYMEVPE